MLELQQTKEFLRVDGDEEDNLISSLIISAKELVEETLRCKLDEFEEVPETVNQAMLIVVATLYEQRQISGDSKNTLDFSSVLDIVRQMLFAYRKEKF